MDKEQIVLSELGLTQYYTKKDVIKNIRIFAVAKNSNIMTHGKDTCNYLKAIRRTIAQENEIDLQIPECTHKGEYLGTCHQCEAEVRFLETVMARRISLGKAASIAGIDFTLASPMAAQVKDYGNNKDNTQAATATPNFNPQDTIRL